MIRHSREVTVLTARLWVLVFAFAFISSFFNAHSSSALSLDPILDDVFSLVRRDKNTTPQKLDSDATDKDKRDNPTGRTLFNGSPQTNLQTPTNDAATLETPIATEPLTELPILDSSVMLAQPIRMAQSQPVTPTSSTVLGVNDAPAVMPLQATSQGWKLFGVVWYWWALFVAVGYYLVRVFRYVQHRRTFEGVAIR